MYSVLILNSLLYSIIQTIQYFPQYQRGKRQHTCRICVSRYVGYIGHIIRFELLLTHRLSRFAKILPKSIPIYSEFSIESF